MAKGRVKFEIDLTDGVDFVASGDEYLTIYINRGSEDEQLSYVNITASREVLEEIASSITRHFSVRDTAKEVASIMEGMEDE
jgi:hypothetical protein